MFYLSHPLQLIFRVAAIRFTKLRQHTVQLCMDADDFRKGKENALFVRAMKAWKIDARGRGSTRGKIVGMGRRRDARVRECTRCNLYHISYCRVGVMMNNANQARVINVNGMQVCEYSATNRAVRLPSPSHSLTLSHPPPLFFFLRPLSLLLSRSASKNRHAFCLPSRGVVVKTHGTRLENSRFGDRTRAPRRKSGRGKAIVSTLFCSHPSASRPPRVQCEKGALRLSQKRERVACSWGASFLLLVAFKE